MFRNCHLSIDDKIAMISGQESLWQIDGKNMNYRWDMPAPYNLVTNYVKNKKKRWKDLSPST